MMSASRWCLFLAVATAACGDSSTTPPAPDSAVVDMPVVEDLPTTPDVAVTPDVRADASDAGPRPMYSPCTSRTQCGTGTICTTIAEGYPGGMCTRSCTTDADCGTTGICWGFAGGGMRCIPTCDTVGDCREGYQCLGITGREDRACFPFCTADSQCAPSACNMWSRTCGTADPARAQNGAPCGASAECRSNRCTREINTDGMPTGSLDGICFSLCTVPANSEYTGANIPRANCPMGSVCPRDTTTTPGGVGLCRVECRTNDNCRPGYICVHPARSASDSTPYENGYCAAMNCRYMTQTCPATATCRTTRTDDAGVAIGGICVRNDPDGGDGSTDASTDATSDRPDAVTATDAGTATDASTATDADVVAASDATDAAG
jgi:hypothetical protein